MIVWCRQNNTKSYSILKSNDFCGIKFCECSLLASDEEDCLTEVCARRNIWLLIFYRALLFYPAVYEKRDIITSGICI